MVDPEKSLLPWLTRACEAAREAAGRKQVHVGASASMDQSSIDRFEKGRAWPRNPDRIINAYADDLDLSPIELWAEALRLWAEDEAQSATQPGRQAATKLGPALTRAAQGAAPAQAGQRQAGADKGRRSARGASGAA